jgi:zinc/manganese transport system substrate-binding protein
MPRSLGLLALSSLLVVAITSCSTTTPNQRSVDGGTVIEVAASINVWGSILSQLGGDHVRETSIITNPATDPHEYEPSPTDGRVIASSKLFIDNGLGYDSWADKTLRASPDPSRLVITVGQLVGVPAGGNPHRWYSPADVDKVADAITADLQRIDPADRQYYADRRSSFETTGLADYHRLINDIKTRYARTPVGASESIFAPLADALGLDLITPPTFLRAISEGTDPSAADKATIDQQIRDKKIKVYVFNSQNSTPDITAQVDAARRQKIPVVAVTETLTPATASFQQWQTTQLQNLTTALALATLH